VRSNQSVGFTFKIQTSWYSTYKHTLRYWSKSNQPLHVIGLLLAGEKRSHSWLCYKQKILVISLIYLYTNNTVVFYSLHGTTKMFDSN